MQAESFGSTCNMVEAVAESLVFLKLSKEVMGLTVCLTKVSALEINVASQRLSLDPHCGDDLSTP